MKNELVEVGLTGAYFLHWISGTEVVVLSKETERNMLGIVDIRSSMVHKTELDTGAKAAFKDPGGGPG